MSHSTSQSPAVADRAREIGAHVRDLAAGLPRLASTVRSGVETNLVGNPEPVEEPVAPAEFAGEPKLAPPPARPVRTDSHTLAGEPVLKPKPTSTSTAPPEPVKLSLTIPEPLPVPPSFSASAAVLETVASSSTPAPKPVAPPLPSPSASTSTSTPASTSTSTPASTSTSTPSASASPAASFNPPSKPKPMREMRERAVPSSTLGRAWGFGTLATSLAVGAAGEWMKRATGKAKPRTDNLSDPVAKVASATSLMLNEANAERLAEGLCRMRGAGLKLGQMLSLQDETLLPPAVADALARVRTHADVMPHRQLNKVMVEDLGEDWKERMGGDWMDTEMGPSPSNPWGGVGFDERPVAAASIGQVHRAVLPDGRRVAVKVQYPGVAESIDSDVDNLLLLLKMVKLPPALYMDNVIVVLRDELKLECDYRYEARSQKRFRDLVASDPHGSWFHIPAIVDELSGRRVLTSEWIDGLTIDRCSDLSQETRNNIARRLLYLTLRELFHWRFMQTDPNWGNFMYNPGTDQVGLIDFGASREYPKPFVDDYLRLVWSAAQRDRDALLEASLRIGFMTGYESATMVDAHVAAGMVVGEPFVSEGTYNFRTSGMTARVAEHGPTFAEERLTPPPNEIFSLHRKLSGAFLICIRLATEFAGRDLLIDTIKNYEFNTPPLSGLPYEEYRKVFLEAKKNGTPPQAVKEGETIRLKGFDGFLPGSGLKPRKVWVRGAK